MSRVTRKEYILEDINILAASAALDGIKRKLLDISNANPLINFNANRKNVLLVFYPSSGELFKAMFASRRYRAHVVDDEALKASLGSGAKKADINDVLQTFRPTKNQILLYNPSQKTFTVLKNIRKKSKEMMDERGLNVLYFAFNFVVWKDAEGEHRAPLMLVPAEIEPVSGKGYDVGEKEDEVVINPAFLFKLKRDGILLPDFGNSGGYDEYLSAVGKVLSAHGMKLERRAVLASFSYEKLAMYDDIEKNKYGMLKHRVIKCMLTDTSMRSVRPPAIDFDRIVEHNVVDADSSQLAAIGYALAGRSFVLQGPPGTGKSQTITNMIAAFLEEGKKVLFVSEKMTALKVVNKKLADAGLGDYCLELHSNKANKKEFIAELHRVADIAPERSVADEVALIRTERKRASEKLDRYGKELAKTIPALGVTVFDLFGIYTGVQDCADVDFFVSDIGKKGFKELDAVLEKLGEYVFYCNAGVDPDYTASPWSELRDSVRVEDKADVYSALRDVADAAQAITGVNAAISAYGLSLDYIDEGEGICEFADAFNKCTVAGASLLDGATRKAMIAAADAYAATKAENDRLCAETRALYDDAVLTADTDAMIARFKGYSGWTRIFNKDYRADTAFLAANRKAGAEKPSYEDTLVQLMRLKKRKESDAALAKAKSALAAFGLNESVMAEMDGVKELDGITQKYGLVTDAMSGLIPRELAAARAVFARCAREVRKAMPALISALGRLDVFFEGFAEATTDVATVEKRAKDHLSQSGFEVYVAMRDIAKELKKSGDFGFITDAVGKGISPDKWKDAYKKCFYFQWIKKVVDEAPDLRVFNADDHNALVRLFCDKDEETLAASRKDIPQKLNAAREKAPADQRMELESQANQGRNQKKVRELLMEMKELIQKLKPCFMMSPLSVSTYLKDADMHFDVVIFDEASQVLPEDAVCAIYRADQVIIVGDSKQMPPCDIFSVGSDDEEEEGSVEDPVALDESVLALGAKIMDGISLKWHYRSRNESLIAFSNLNFYEGNLQTFPSNVVNRPDWGVEHVYVPDGVYENNVNEKEADAVVDLVIRHVGSHPERSLGVVAFGIKQRDLIEDKLNARLASLSLPAAKTFFAEDAPEPFFVKNLETVQGDERDTVIFSMGYGKDASGKFSHNFGLLNRVGGERRLNVAITRAKYNIKMVTSVRPDEIRATKDSSMGVQMLKAYVAYAAGGGVSGVKAGSGAGLIRNVEDDIYDCLVAEGYSVERNVGASKYKVDLAVRRVGTTEYALAIECDGKDYQAVSSTRDRDRLRNKVLESMGWKVYRIWSLQWIRERETEKRKLLNFVRIAAV